MAVIDSREEIKALDHSNVLGSVEALPKQILDAWEKTKNADFKNYVQDIHNIVVSGMGGSALGGGVIRTVFKDSLKVPMEIVNHYQLPEYVNEHSLVLLSSYSGTTEETLAAAEDAKKRGAKIAVIAAGGGLKDLADANGYPTYIIDPVYNPSNQPRMAIGYSVFGTLGLFHSMGLLNLTDSDISEVAELLNSKAEELKPESTQDNPAKQLAYSAVDRLIYLVSAEHLSGAAHVFNNQLNENAKQLTAELQIPELNHHYMEALSFPKVMQGQAIFWFLNSNLYHDRVQNRTVLTQMVVNKAGHLSETVLLTGKSKLAQAFELIQLGAYTNFYLAMLNRIDPAPIPTVDYFKDELKKV